MVSKESSSPSDTPPVKDKINPYHLISQGREPRSSGKEGLQPTGSEKWHDNAGPQTVTGLLDSLLIAM